MAKQAPEHALQTSAQHLPEAPACSRRQFLRCIGATATSAVLGACVAAEPSPVTGAGGPVQLVYQDWRTPWFPPMAQQMLEEFHATHPNIRVFYTPDPADFADRMLADFEAGTAPDVFQGCCAHFPAWAQKGYTLDLRPFVQADLDRSAVDDWNPAQYRSLFLPDGQQYGLPKYHGALALYYNKDLFDLYGVTYPDETWEHSDYLEAMRRLTHSDPLAASLPETASLWGSMLDVSWERVQVHVNGWGGHLVDPDDPTHCRMAEPEAMAALEWLRARMWDDRVMATSLDVRHMTTRQAFSEGRVAMVEDGSWALKDILTAASFRIGVAPFPAGPVRRVTLATTDGFGIYAGTRHPEAAWELVKFLISKSYGRAMARASFLQPARASLLEDWMGYVRGEFPDKAKEMNLAAFADGHLKGYSVTGEIFANMAQAQRITYAVWEQILTLGQGHVEQMEEVCRQIEAAQQGQD